MQLYQPTTRNQSGFSVIEALLIVLVVAALTATVLVVYQRHKPSSAKNNAVTNQTQSTTQPQSTATTQTQQTATQYLTIKEWGVKLPLSDAIKDAYYVVPSGITNDPDGQPSGIYLGLTSLNSRCGSVSPGSSTSVDNALGAITRVPPTYTDPISGKLYTQEYPNGVTIGNYYYTYASRIRGKTCAPQITLQSIDSAFAAAAKDIVAATN